jgi:hypothetical protein
MEVKDVGTAVSDTEAANRWKDQKQRKGSVVKGHTAA